MAVADEVVQTVENAGANVDLGRGIGNASQQVLPVDDLLLMRPQQPLDIAAERADEPAEFGGVRFQLGTPYRHRRRNQE